MPVIETLKTCPNCNASDRTDWRTCRHCGTKYSAVVPRHMNFSDDTIVAKIVVIVLTIAVAIFAVSSVHIGRTSRLDPIKQSVLAAHKPRVMEFFVAWVDPSYKYETIFDSLGGKYGREIDFQRLDAADPANAQLVKMLDINYPPTTCFFNRYGKLTMIVPGAMSAAQLEGYVTDLVARDRKSQQQEKM